MIYIVSLLRKTIRLKLIYNHIDEIWSIDLADFFDCKISNNSGYRFSFLLIDKFKWAIPLKNKNAQTITKVFSIFFLKSKRRPNKLETDRETEFFNLIFQNFLKVKNLRHYSGFTDKGPSTAERVIKAIS